MVQVGFAVGLELPSFEGGDGGEVGGEARDGGGVGREGRRKCVRERLLQLQLGPGDPFVRTCVRVFVYTYLYSNTRTYVYAYIYMLT